MSKSSKSSKSASIVSCVTKYDIKDGRLDDAKIFLTDMVAKIASEEPGTLLYEFYVNEEGTTVHCYARFKDNEALFTHLTNVGPYWASVLDVSVPKELTMSGPINEVNKAALVGLFPSHELYETILATKLNV